MKTVRAHFDGKVLVPDEPVDLPLNLSLELKVLSRAEVDNSPSPLKPWLNSPAAFRSDPRTGRIWLRSMIITFTACQSGHDLS